MYYFYLLKVAYLIGSTLIEQSTVQVISEEQSVKGKGLSSSTSIIPFKHHSTDGPYSFIYHSHYINLAVDSVVK